MSQSENLPIEIKRILVPTDFSSISIQALEYAALIAKKSDAEIMLLHVYESYAHNTMIGASVDFNKMIEDGITQKLLELKSMIPALLGITVHTAVVTGKIHVEIERIAKETDAQLIVMGTHGVSGTTNIGKYIVGSNAYRTIQNAPCPIITIRNEPWKKSFQHIVVPISSSRHSTEKLDLAIAWSKFFGSTLHLLAVTALFEEFIVDAKSIDRKVHQAEERLVSEGIPYTAHIIRNQTPSVSILHHADKMEADMIMVVTGEESQLGEMLFGSTARSVVSDSPYPVLSLNIGKNQ